MEKLLEKYHKMSENLNIASGLLAAIAIVSRKLLEAKTAGEKDILLSCLEDLTTLMNKAELYDDDAPKA